MGKMPDLVKYLIKPFKHKLDKKYCKQDFQEKTMPCCSV